MGYYSWTYCSDPTALEGELLNNSTSFVPCPRDWGAAEDVEGNVCPRAQPGGSFTQATQQSPIDIVTVAVVEDMDSSIYFTSNPNDDGDPLVGCENYEMLTDGHTWEVAFHCSSSNNGTEGEGAQFVVATTDGEEEGEAFVLEQFHFHSPSEHTVDGKHFDLEVHAVHSGSESGAGLVVAAFVDVSEDVENEWFAKFWSEFPSAPDTAAPEAMAMPDPFAFDVYGELFGAFSTTASTFYRYNGSLTTPPCTENVQWLVRAEPTLASHDQLTSYIDALKSLPQTGYSVSNNRPLQPRNSRVISSIIASSPSFLK